jgi:hypothetical protein
MPPSARTPAPSYACQPADGAAAYGDERPSGDDDWHIPEVSVILKRCIETDDPQALKFAEACIREHRRNPQPAYLAAAHDWAARVHRAKNWSAHELAAAGIDFQ